MRSVSLLLLVLLITPTVLAVSEIRVSSSTAFIGDTVTIEVSCDPNGKFVKGWETPLVVFDATILRCDEVTCGPFFDGYQQFFISGVIDNSNGTITNVYNLIVGRTGNVSRSGQLYFINFTALKVGNTSITLPGRNGICNESVYLSLTVIEGAVNVSAKDWIQPPPPVNETEPDEPYIPDEVGNISKPHQDVSPPRIMFDVTPNDKMWLLIGTIAGLLFVCLIVLFLSALVKR